MIKMFDLSTSFSHPHVRARLEKHMGSNLVRLTDKTYMTDLEERIRAVNEENLNKRITSRVVRLIALLFHSSIFYARLH